MKKTKQTITLLDQQIQDLSQRDAEIYRSILGLDKATDEEALLGIGGSNLYEEYEITAKMLGDIGMDQPEIG